MIPFRSLCWVMLSSLIAVLPASAGEECQIIVDATLPSVAERALVDLESVLKSRDFEVVRRNTMPAKGPVAIVVGTAGTPQIDRLLEAHRIPLPKEPESLCIRKIRDGDRPRWLIAGRDERGLSYGLTEVAQ